MIEINEILFNFIYEDLTYREHEVFVLLGQGKKRAEIAKEMNLSIKTVSSYIETIKIRLRIKNVEMVRVVATLYFQWKNNNE